MCECRRECSDGNTEEHLDDRSLVRVVYEKPLAVYIIELQQGQEEVAKRVNCDEGWDGKI
jgi:hypothetical protein